MLTNLLIALVLIVISLTIALNSDRIYSASESLINHLIRFAKRLKFIADAFVRAVRHTDRYPYYS